jgi:hypothetical protein
MDGLDRNNGFDAHVGSLPVPRSETMRDGRASEAIARDLLHSACIFHVAAASGPASRYADWRTRRAA